MEDVQFKFNNIDMSPRYKRTKKSKDLSKTHEKVPTMKRTQRIFDRKPFQLHSKETLVTIQLRGNTSAGNDNDNTLASPSPSASQIDKSQQSLDSPQRSPIIKLEQLEKLRT